MNKKLLCAALLGGLSLAQAAQAQDFDDRWYLTGSVGFNVQDNDRGTRDAPFGTIGVGKFISPNWSFDGELNYQKPVWDYNQDLNWGQYGISFDARYHFISEGRNWNPYLVMGLGWQEEEIELDNFPNPDSPRRGKRGRGFRQVRCRHAGRHGSRRHPDGTRVSRRCDSMTRRTVVQRRPVPGKQRR